LSTANASATINFDRIIDRTDTPSLKWHHYGEDVLPMWVADMDFRSPEPVIRALKERAEHGIFGYERSPSDLREIITDRLEHLYHWKVNPRAIVFLPGVVPGFNLATRAFVAPDEGLLIQTPVYMHILHAADVAGVRSDAMKLTQQPSGRYLVDFDRFEATIRDSTRMFLLCNPHNPVGRVFTQSELERMAASCLRHDTLICSDEIHCDLTFNGYEHIPIAALDPEIAAQTITLMAPSKTFNIAGLGCAFAVIPNADLRKQYNEARGHLVGHTNLMGYTAARAAYREGGPWLETLTDYLTANRALLIRTVEETMPQIGIAPPEGMYLAWLDCRSLDLAPNPHAFFLNEGKVALNNGADFGPGGDGFVRLNFGCPRSQLREGLRRMKAALDTR
jgi:cysteine-S-conjugate beta-lyase